MSGYNMKDLLARRQILALLGLTGAGVSLTGCGGLLPNIGPAPNVYDLSPKSTFRPDLPQVSRQLVIEEPVAASGLDTTRIALKPTPYEYKYFAESRWSDRAPRLVQTLLVESFENSGKIVAVGRQAIGLRSDFNLKSELRAFQAEYENEENSPPSVNVRLNVKLIKQPRQEIVAAASFERIVKASGTNIQNIIQAFDEALNFVFRRVVEWGLTSIPPEQPNQTPAHTPTSS